MSAPSCQFPQDQFLCSICLDVFTDPVSTPCGHNFCRNCITKHWDVNTPYRCPVCTESFLTRPNLRINTLISEMVSQFKQSAQRKADSGSGNSEQQVLPAGEIPCDICTGSKLKAVKSCLICLASYCQTHLERHLTFPGLRSHHLIAPAENLEGRMCTKHDKPLELFCKTDQECVCMLCPILDHKNHNVVGMNEEYREKMAELVTMEGELRQMIRKRELRIQEIKKSVALSGENAERSQEEAVEVCDALVRCVERSLGELVESIAERQGTMEQRAEDLIQKLEKEISELKRVTSETVKLSRVEEHHHLIQRFPSVKAIARTTDWTEVSIRPLSFEGWLERSLAQLERTLYKHIRTVFTAELRRVQWARVDVTLDPDTAHPNLVLSNDRKQVRLDGSASNIPNNPKRFSLNPCVLGAQGFSSGCFYFEVQVQGKTDWDLGVANQSVKRKENVPLSPREGYWTIWRRSGNKHKALADPPVPLSLGSQAKRVGVFVNYEEGVVSFYDTDAATLIYSFTGCSFNETLYPYFSPGLNSDGKNSDPLIICTTNDAL